MFYFMLPILTSMYLLLFEFDYRMSNQILVEKMLNMPLSNVVILDQQMPLY